MARLFRRLLALMPLCACFAAHAASIGEIRVSSHLGEPLRARVPITLDEESLIQDNCVRLVGAARQHPDLADAEVALIGQGAQRMVSIRTDNPVNDPMIDLTLRSEGCGPTLQKDFVVLLSPRDLPPPEPAPIRAAAPVRAPLQSLAAERPRPAPPPREGAPRQYNLKLDYNDDHFGRLAERIVARKQAAYLGRTTKPNRPRVGANVSQDARQLLDAPPAQAKPTPGPAASATAQPTPTPLPVTPPASESQFSLAPPPEDFVPIGPAGEPSSQAAQGGAGTSQTDTGAGGRTRAGLDTGLSMPAQSESSTSWLAWLMNPYNLLVLLLILLFALLVALWLKRQRSQREPYPAHSPATLPPLIDDETARMPANAHPGGAAAAVADASDAFRMPPAATPNLNDILDLRPPASAVEPLEFQPGPKSIMGLSGLSVETHDSFDQVMELAEVMLAFGRSGQAMDALRQHIRDNPRQSVDPWLKLLDLYHQAGQRSDFEALSDELHRNYNVANVQWDDFVSDTPAEAGPLTLESLPHVMQHLTESWNTPEGLAYLDKLLSDNRGGQRLGFPMPIVRDILLLRDILRHTSQVAPLSR